MNAFRAKFVLSTLVSIGGLSALACDGGGTDPIAAAGAANNPQPMAGTGGAPDNGSAGSPAVVNGGSGGGEGNVVADPTKAKLVPDATGWVDYDAEGNTVGVQGAWYPYGDAYGEATCLMKGMHSAAECSVIDSPPPPPAEGFENTGGVMCTKGTVAKAKCDTCTEADWANIWGAGIGLDLASAGGMSTVKNPFKAIDSGVIGVGFNVSFPTGVNTLKNMRVEFPMQATEGHADGSAYWMDTDERKGSATSFPASPIMEGWNELKWEWVRQPGKGEIMFDANAVTAIQFHVYAQQAKTTPYEFCISDLTFITNGNPVKAADPGGEAPTGGGGAPSASGGAPSTGGGGASAGGAPDGTGGTEAAAGSAGTAAGTGGTDAGTGGSGGTETAGTGS